jgi:integrase
VLAITWNAYDGQSLTLNRQKTGEPIWVPCHSRLKQALDDTPRVAVTIVTSSKGQPFTVSGLTTAMSKLVRSMVADGTLARSRTFHGLRHFAGTRVIDAGGDSMDVKAFLAHRSINSTMGYIESADRRRRSAASVARLEQKPKKGVES